MFVIHMSLRLEIIIPFSTDSQIISYREENQQNVDFVSDRNETNELTAIYQPQEVGRVFRDATKKVSMGVSC